MVTRMELIASAKEKRNDEDTLEIEFLFITDPALVRQLADALRQHRFPGEQLYENGNLDQNFRQNLAEYLATIVPAIALRAKLPDLTILQQIQIAQNFIKEAVAPHSLPFKVSIRRYKKKDSINSFLYLYVATSENPRGPYATLDDAKRLTANWQQIWCQCLQEASAKPHPWRKS